MFRRIVDGGIKKPVALASNHAQREIFVFDQVSAKVTFLSDSGRFITQISTKLKTDLTGMVHFSAKIDNLIIEDADSINTSFPNFIEKFNKAGGNIL